MMVAYHDHHDERKWRVRTDSQVVLVEYASYTTTISTSSIQQVCDAIEIHPWFACSRVKDERENWKKHCECDTSNQ